MTWSTNYLTTCFFKQSPVFKIGESQWRLFVSFMKANDPDLRVEIKLVNNPYDIKQNKQYFKKKDFELPSNLDDKKLDPIA